MARFRALWKFIYLIIPNIFYANFLQRNFIYFFNTAPNFCTLLYVIFFEIRGLYLYT